MECKGNGEGMTRMERIDWTRVERVVGGINFGRALVFGRFYHKKGVPL